MDFDAHCANKPIPRDQLVEEIYADLKRICSLHVPVRPATSAILGPAYPPSAKIRSMKGNSRRARRSNWKAPSRS
jgi:hypothetical protein